MKDSTISLRAPHWVLGLCLTLAGAGAFGQPSDKIQFTPPREASTARPAAKENARERILEGQRRDAPSIANELPLGMTLPAPDDVNRLRLLQALVEKRRDQLSGMDSGLGTSESGDDLGTQISIDDLFEKYGMNSDRRDREGDNDSRQERRREELRRREDDSNRDESGSRSGDRSRSDRESDFKDGNRKGEGEFLPSMDARDREFRNSLNGGGGRAADSFLRGEGGLVASPTVAREREDLAKSRAERADAIRKLIGGSRAISSTDTGAGGYRGVTRDGKSGYGVAGGAPATAGARTLGDALGNRGGGAPSPAVPEALAGGGVGRGFQGPMRDLGVDTRAGGGGLGVGRIEALVPQERPLQMLQQKHDTRIPSRPF